jgi:hypothetical protein
MRWNGVSDQKDYPHCELKQLESRMQPDIILDCIAPFSGATNVEPRNFEQAWNHNNPEDQEKWRMAIKKEFNDMNEKKIWEKIKKEDIPNGRRKAIDCKWIFKIKRNGIFRA